MLAYLYFNPENKMYFRNFRVQEVEQPSNLGYLPVQTSKLPRSYTTAESTIDTLTFIHISFYNAIN